MLEAVPGGAGRPASIHHLLTVPTRALLSIKLQDSMRGRARLVVCLSRVRFVDVIFYTA